MRTTLVSWRVSRIVKPSSPRNAEAGRGSDQTLFVCAVLHRIASGGTDLGTAALKLAPPIADRPSTSQQVNGNVSNRLPTHPAYVQWLRSRVGSLEALRRAGRLDEIALRASELKESADAMGYEEITAAAGAVRRLVDVDVQALEAAIEILRRV